MTILPIISYLSMERRENPIYRLAKAIMAQTLIIDVATMRAWSPNVYHVMTNGVMSHVRRQVSLMDPTTVIMRRL